MAKRGIKIEEIKSFVNSNKKWSLCVGAGVNKGIMPDWNGLIEELMKRICSHENIIEFEKLKSLGFSQDAMLQAIKNNSEMDDDTFIRELSSVLYSNINQKLNDAEKKCFLRLFKPNIPAYLFHHEEQVTNIIEKCFKDITASKIARVIVDSMISGNTPFEILTFNGDDILYILLCYYYFEKTRDATNHFKPLVNSLNGFETGITYVVHCHGVIPHNESKVRIGNKANDKLVFSESSYLQLANTSSSFQANHFISACMNSSIIFVGVSLTDSNMRKWLSWVHQMKLNDLIQNVGEIEENCTEHYWINTMRSSIEMKWIEESVAHLGVRLIWINSWDEVGIALEKILGIDNKHRS